MDRLGLKSILCGDASGDFGANKSWWDGRASSGFPTSRRRLTTLTFTPGSISPIGWEDSLGAA
jgi:hypothetical protein